MQGDVTSIKQQNNIAENLYTLTTIINSKELGRLYKKDG